MIRADQPSFDRLEQIIRPGWGRREGRRSRFDDYHRVDDRRIVHLTPLHVVADRGDMRARREPLAPYDRLEGICGRTNDVCAVAGLLPGRRRGHREVELAGQFLRERLGLRAVTPGDTQLLERPDACDRAGMRAGLDPGAEDGECGGILAREEPRGEGGAGPSADRGDRGAVEKRCGLSVVGVETAITAWCVGSAVPALPGKSVTSLLASAPAEGV